MNEINPYEAPATAESGPSMEVAHQEIPTSASLGLRFANFIVDRFAVVGVTFCMGFVVGMLGGLEFVESSGVWIDLTLGIGGTLVYYAATESIFGRTLGKLITGTKVIGEDGFKPSFGRAMLRTLCRFIPFEPFSFFGAERRGWHDSIAKTWVVKSR